MGIFLSILGIVVGILILRFSAGILNLFGRDPDAEKYLGSGGTYTFIKLFGLACVVVSLMYLLGFFR